MMPRAVTIGGEGAPTGVRRASPSSIHRRLPAASCFATLVYLSTLSVLPALDQIVL